MRYLILGGTGTLGKALVPLLLQRKDTERIRIMARNEHNINSMRAKYTDSPIDFIIGSGIIQPPGNIRAAGIRRAGCSRGEAHLESSVVVDDPAERGVVAPEGISAAIPGDGAGN